MPALDQGLGVDQALLGLVAHAVGRMPVHQAFAGDQAQTARLCSVKQGVDRGRVRSGKGQRRGHAVAGQLVQKESSHLGRVRRVGKAAFLRECVVLQPGQQAVGGRADHVHLRAMNVHVHKAGRQNAAGQMLHLQLRILRRKFAPGPYGLYTLAAAGVRRHHQQAVFFINGRMVIGKTEDGGAVGFHGFKVSAVQPWRCVAARDKWVLTPINQLNN